MPYAYDILNIINRMHTDESDKYRRMFLGVNNRLTTITKEIIIINSAIDYRFFRMCPRSIEAYAYEIATSFKHYIVHDVKSYSVRIFYVQYCSGFREVAIPDCSRCLDDILFRHHLLFPFYPMEPLFMESIEGSFAHPVNETPDYQNVNRFSIHPRLLPWTRRWLLKRMTN